MMSFGQRMAGARKSIRKSQEQLAKSIGVHAPLIGRYERGEVKPSIEVANKIANVLGTSLDYLVGNIDDQIGSDSMKRIVDLQSLEEEEKGHIYSIIDAYVRDVKARRAYAS